MFVFFENIKIPWINFSPLCSHFTRIRDVKDFFHWTRDERFGATRMEGIGGNQDTSRSTPWTTHTHTQTASLSTESQSVKLARQQKLIIIIILNKKKELKSTSSKPVCIERYILWRRRRFGALIQFETGEKGQKKEIAGRRREWSHHFSLPLLLFLSLTHTHSLSLYSIYPIIKCRWCKCGSLMEHN